MDTNYRANIAKWLPLSGGALDKWLVDASLLDEKMGKLAGCIALVIEDFADIRACDLEVFEEAIDSLEELMESYKSTSSPGDLGTHPIYRYKMNHLSMVLKRKLNVVAKFTRNLIIDIVDCKNEEIIRTVFRLVNVYNSILDIDRNVLNSSVNVFYNDCPYMLEPLKKISVTKVLQILAKNRAEESCHELIDCLLANYEPREKTESTSATNDVDVSENSSIEIYRALTRHLTPPIASATSTSEVEISNIESVQTLVNTQNEQILRLLNVVQEVSPQLLGVDALKTSKGETRLRSSAIKKVKNYYQEVAWGALSGILDHVILWWSREALATHHSHGAQHLKDWLRQFIQGNEIPSTVRPALQNLCDALGYHTTITAWDQQFRLAYTSAFECHSRPSTTEGTDTGQMFVELFQLLVTLSNECEVGGEWVVGAPLVELPLSEQIVVLHRMDHSVHTARLWAIQETKTVAHTWDLDVFFLLVKGDVANCLEELSYLKLADHTTALESTDSISVQVYVCTKMRAKIVSEVKANVELLQICSAQCIDTLAKICRVVSLANLHMCFPRSDYWRRSSSVAPVAASLYVETYFEKVLLPVLEVTEDHETSNMILRIMCEAWLDYIYLHRIKFSEYGALQLLTDFAYVSTWVTECSIISQNIRNHLLKNEVLRRCEGVGRLLLRHPGEAIAMHKRLARRTNERGSPESPGLERMPAEMYVPNQEQWLELRASKRYNFCCTE
ncbi:coiled-coil domain-containing protein 142 [Harpegnathos saltator]|uniref:Coiled-coil domain-containing protein 142 n=1 Tax=Harpegnathos saltator TaxID=610380 RepID=E2BYM4_HARSA|nr:coiled-coil domain-containing protein 142 [Harpegnathos saltator]EFN79178.1 Coiled-coil domain-containing protein 142 [Harpegnathos saltator]